MIILHWRRGRLAPAHRFIGSLEGAMLLQQFKTRRVNDRQNNLANSNNLQIFSGLHSPANQLVSDARLVSDDRTVRISFGNVVVDNLMN